jgi:hypothetical protein
MTRNEAYILDGCGDNAIRWGSSAPYLGTMCPRGEFALLLCGIAPPPRLAVKPAVCLLKFVRHPVQRCRYHNSCYILHDAYHKQNMVVLTPYSYMSGDHFGNCVGAKRAEDPILLPMIGNIGWT